MRQTKKSKFAPSNTRTRGRKQPVRLKIESMEDRTVPTAVPLLPAQHDIGTGPFDKTALVGNTLYFSAGSSTGSSSLWQTDGTATGTSAVGGTGMAGLSPMEAASFNGKVYFTAAGADGRVNLFAYNPASDRGHALEQLTQVPAGEGISGIQPAYNRVYFWSTSNTGGQTTQTLMMVGANNQVTTLRQFTGGVVDIAGSEAVGTFLYFRVATAAGQPASQLWYSDGYQNGTQPMTGPGTDYAGTQLNADPVGVQGLLFFTATDGTGVSQLWAAKARNIAPLGVNGVDNLTAAPGGVVVFTATGEHGTIIGFSDGSRQGTLPVADSSRFPSTLDKSTIDNLAVAHSIVYFTANETNTGNELWMAQGNIVSLVRDIEPGPGSSNPQPLANARETLYFSAENAADGTALYATDGTTQGTGIAANLDASSGRPGTGFVEVVNNRIVVGASPVTPPVGTATRSTASQNVDQVTVGGSGAQLYALTGTPQDPDREAPAPASYSLGISAASTNVAYGSGVTLRVQVTPQEGAPAATGRLRIFDGGSQVGSTDIGPNGQAVWTSSTTIRPGVHTFTARYTNSGTEFTSSQVSVTVNQVSTNTNIASSASTAPLGQAVTFTATVGGTDLPTTGTVTFRSGNTVIGTAQVIGRTAKLTVNNLSAGGYQVKATYEGNQTIGSSTSNPVALTVAGGRVMTRTRLTTSVGAIQAGQPVTLTATVFCGGGYYPTGTVTFRDGATVLGTAQVDSAQQARLTVNNLATGSRSITASFTGSDMYMNSVTDARTVTITPPTNQRSATSVRVTSSEARINVGRPITLTANVTTLATGATATGGTVTFRDGNTVIGTSQVTNGIATLSTTFATRGVHAITATYAGIPRFSGSNSRATYVTVRGVDVTTSLTVDGRHGQATLTAVVTPRDAGSGSPTGRLVFFDGANQLGSVEVTNGRAVWTGTTGYGSRTFRAVFQGTGAFNDISSPSVNYSIRYPVSMTLIAPQPPANGFSTFIFTVTPLTPGAPPANGRVTFMEGSTQLATVPVVNGVAQLRVGSNGRAYRYFTAVYQGGDLYESGTPTPVVYGTPTGTSTDRVAPMPPIQLVHALPTAI